MDNSHGDSLVPNADIQSTSASYAEKISNENHLDANGALFRNYIVVLNAKSGSADLPGLRTYMEERAVALGKNLHFLELHKDMNLEKELKILSEAQGIQVYIAAGGDGTLAAVADCARRHDKVFAAIPCGTANVFAKEHGIPGNAKDAAELALSGNLVVPVDILDVSGKTFLCHISIGTYSWITLHTKAEQKRKYGRIAYIASAIKLMLKEKIWNFEIVVDGKRMVRKASTIMVTNAGSMGATTMRWGENIATDDGIAEVCVFKARTMKHYFALLFSFIFRREHKHLKEYFQVYKEASIRGSSDLPVRADGEKISNGGFVFKIVKHGLKVILPDTFVRTVDAV
jgi:diacylglycerol kinase (ATP)